jgi:hypothetical protein
VSTYAYADPPYLGYSRFYRDLHPDAMDYDDPATHQALIDRLVAEYPDGWALSLTSGNLHDILPMVPRDCRIAAWVKPFASFKPGVNPGYTWEPLIFRGGRRRTDKAEATVRDYCSTPITLRRCLTGAKPEAFCRWVLDLLGFQVGDTIDDVFPGTGVMGRVADAVALEFALPFEVADA